jgi:hypothetical protein
MVLIVLLLHKAWNKSMQALPGLVVSQTWLYQGQIEKVTVPMVFSY